MDNTLIHTNIDFPGLKTSLKTLLENHGLSTEGFDISSSTSDYLNFLKNEKMSLFDDAMKIIENFELVGIEEATIEDDVQTVLEQLQKKVKLGILTNNMRKTTLFLLEKFDIKEYFDVIVCRDDVMELKPSPQGLLYAVEQLGLKKEEIIYVGDSWIDGEAAARAGVSFVGFGEGIMNDSRISCSHVITSISQLLHIKKFGKESNDIN